jgi:uncharacterized membrane protein YcaP (DUF421 family)
MTETLLHHLSDAVGDPWTILFTALRVIVVYAVVLVLLHWSGRRILGQMTPFDLLTLLLLANVVQGSMIGPDPSLVGGLVGAIVLLMLNRWVSRNRRLRQRLEPSPSILVFRGKVVEAQLKAEGVSVEELEAAAREHGLPGLAEVETAVLELDGSVSIIAGQGAQPRHIRHIRTLRKG